MNQLLLKSPVCVCEMIGLGVCVCVCVDNNMKCNEEKQDKHVSAFGLCSNGSNTVNAWIELLYLYRRFALYVLFK